WSPAEARAFAAEVLPAARYLFVGQAEAREVFGLTGTAEETLAALAREAPKATITLLQGEAGAAVLAEGRLVRARRRHGVQVVDPVGAGDAYVAGFLWAILRGRGVDDAVEAGGAVAALQGSTRGDVGLGDVRSLE